MEILEIDDLEFPITLDELIFADKIQQYMVNLNSYCYA